MTKRFFALWAVLLASHSAQFRRAASEMSFRFTLATVRRKPSTACPKVCPLSLPTTSQNSDTASARETRRPVDW
jgi:hypothetical protein